MRVSLRCRSTGESFEGRLPALEGAAPSPGDRPAPRDGTSAGKVRIAVVYDSSSLRQAVSQMLADEVGIELVGLAACGEELLLNLDTWRPDAVVLDLSSSGWGGLSTLDGIMACRPVPVVLLSACSRDGAPSPAAGRQPGSAELPEERAFSRVDFDALRQALVGKIREIAAQAGVPSRSGDRGTAARPTPEVVLIGLATGAFGEVIPLPRLGARLRRLWGGALSLVPGQGGP